MEILGKKQMIPNHFLAASRKRFTGDCAPHGHEFFEIEYILSGTGTYLIDGVAHAVAPNTLVLLTPASIHAVQGTDMELFNVMFEAEAGDPHARHTLLLGSAVFLPQLEHGDVFATLLSELVDMQEHDPHYASLLLRCILQKLSHAANTPPKTLHAYTQRAILFVMNNFQKGITLEETAHHLGLSKAYFSDLFRRQTGKHFKTYLDDIRFSYAENLLLLTDLPVSEIYHRAGFADYANFSRRFKERHSLTPTAYRNKSGKNKERR